jgi:hypothetical protein
LAVLYGGLTCGFSWLFELDFVRPLLPYTEAWNWSKIFYYLFLYIFYGLMLPVMEERFYHDWLLNALGPGIQWDFLVNIFFAAKKQWVNYRVFSGERWWVYVLMGKFFAR